MCNDKNIKELLPAYLNQGLGNDDQLRVETHLKSCADCRFEASLLQTMIGDTVPDPGEAFWGGMPGRVYRAVQQEKINTPHFDVPWLLGRITLPRWVFAAATVCIVLAISWSAIRSLHSIPSQPQEYVISDASLGMETVSITTLNQEEINAITVWAGEALASIGREAEPFIGADMETDIYDQVAELGPKETEQLATMLEQWQEEEQS